jgi:predicted ribosomally synthesized peptide with nif11-like leader
MTKSAEILLKRMGEDRAFAEKILSQTEKEKVIEIAKDEGIELTMEDIDEINESITKVLQLKKGRRTVRGRTGKCGRRGLGSLLGDGNISGCIRVSNISDRSIDLSSSSHISNVDIGVGSVY